MDVLRSSHLKSILLNYVRVYVDARIAPVRPLGVNCPIPIDIGKALNFLMHVDERPETREPVVPCVNPDLWIGGDVHPFCRRFREIHRLSLRTRHGEKPFGPTL